MPVYHLQHKIPWQILHEAFSVKKKKKMEHLYSDLHSGIERVTYDDPDRSKVLHFCNCFSKAVSEFSDTEIKKYDSIEISAVKELYTDDQCDRLLLKKYQTLESWNVFLSDNLRNSHDTSHISFGGELCDIVKEFFNRNDMYPLLGIAKAVKHIDKLAFVTWSNFFHWGYRKVLEDSMVFYFLLNFIFNEPGYEQRRWKILETSLAKNDKYDASLHYYRRLLSEEGNICTEDDQGYDENMPFAEKNESNKENAEKIPSLSDERIRQTQKFAFRCIYQYNMFWNEVLKYSKDKTLKQIDWNVEIVNCLQSLI